MKQTGAQMFIKTKIANSVRLGIAIGLTGSMVFTSNIASAQDEDESVIEKIQVTGSRIARTELSAPSPTLTISAEEVARFGTPDIGSILAELPAIAAGSSLIGNNNDNANAGLSSPDLRNLGRDRTLTLVNGKRHVAGAPGTSAVDTGAIPAALIERIDVITGGASAIYGSDAVSGAINLVLKDDFEGIQLNFNGTKGTEGVGNQNFNYNALVGATTEDGRGNVTFFAEYQSISEVGRTDLQQARAFGSILNPAESDIPAAEREENGIPDLIGVPWVGSEFINNFGVINPFGGGPRITFLPDGTPIDQVERIETNSFAFGSFNSREPTVFFTDEFINYLPEQKTVTLASTARYDITENLRFYGDFKYVDKDIAQQFQPSFNFGGLAINVAENAFLDEATRDRLTAGGQGGIVPFSRFNGDLGNRSAANDRELFRLVAGVKGDFELSKTFFDYDLFYTYGQTNNVRITENTLITSNFTAALDSVIDPATGEAACRSQVPSAQGDDYEDPALVNGANCSPFNPFGFGNNSQAAVDFITSDATRTDEITQEIFGGSVSFDTAEFLNLPGGAIGVALGFEYREETSETTTDSFTRAGLTQNAATPNSFGSFDVEEFFVEVNLPILSDMFLLQELSVGGAFRAADYSHAGSADAWQVNLSWAPIEDVRLRATVSESVRAPNISEAFSPQTPGFSVINDPCDDDNIADDADRAANCAALGIPAGFQANDNVSIDTITGGNPELFSETADSTTLGVVWTPEFIDNFSITVDYYDIEIADAITNVEPQAILDNCVDATDGPDAVFCAQIDRDPVTNDVSLVRSGFVNAAALTTKGVEAQLLYRTEMDRFELPGELRVNIFANKLLELERFAFQTRPDEIDVEEGEIGDPKIQWRTTIDYRLDDWNFNWTSRFLDRSASFDVTPETGDTPEDAAVPFIGSVWTHDLSATYILNENVRLFGGMRNVFNKVTPSFTFDPLYDLVGRRVNLGVQITFE